MKWMRFQELLQIVSILCLTHSHTCSGLLRKERLRRSSGSAVADDSSIPTSSATAESIYEKLYKGIINHGEQAVDIILLLDSSASMTRSNFEIGRNFLAKLTNSLPRHKFLDRSVRVGMISYSISEWLVSEFNLSWTGGMYREMVRRAIKRASFQDGIENHGAISMLWAYSMLKNSTRFENSAKVILYVTNGHVTDRDAFKQRYPIPDAWQYVSDFMQQNGVTVFMVSAGSNYDQNALEVMASSPSKDHVIHVQNEEAALNITSHLKRLIRSPASHS